MPPSPLLQQQPPPPPPPLLQQQQPPPPRQRPPSPSPSPSPRHAARGLTPPLPSLEAVVRDLPLLEEADTLMRLESVERLFLELEGGGEGLGLPA